MKKSMVFVLMCMLLLTLTPALAHAQYSTGDAVGASIGGGTLSGLSFTGKTESLPIMFGAGLGYSSGNFGISVTGDYWMIQEYLGRVSLADAYFYLGPGVDVGLLLGQDFKLDLGIRMPVGVSWLIDSPGWEKWELFTELAVGLNVIGFWTNDQFSTLTLLGLPLGQDVPFNVFNTMDLGFSIGARYWL